MSHSPRKKSCKPSIPDASPQTSVFSFLVFDPSTPSVSFLFRKPITSQIPTILRSTVAFSCFAFATSSSHSLSFCSRLSTFSSAIFACFVSCLRACSCSDFVVSNWVSVVSALVFYCEKTCDISLSLLICSWAWKLCLVPTLFFSAVLALAFSLCVSSLALSSCCFSFFTLVVDVCAKFRDSMILSYAVSGETSWEAWSSSFSVGSVSVYGVSS
ncbi:hypothetical protein EJ02DRAFT_79709 [Clathrospora elynae]|uniref:Uncharacterized protein n=1 Tax=Clathrospora elynae TaxID=706981 RepID=A0A6A5SVX9_9PLEO|nr:hypothetical protein EJ02DRAFT_79709 [Clathrospora elynae]